MVLRITWGKLRAGAWDEFERTYRANVVTKEPFLFFGAAMLLYFFFSLVSAWGIGKLEQRTNRGFAAFGGATR